MASLTNISVAQSVKNWKLIDYHKLTPTGAGKQCILADIRSYLVCPFLNGKRTWPTGSSYYRYIVHVYISFSVIYSARVDSEIFFQLATDTQFTKTFDEDVCSKMFHCFTTAGKSFFGTRIINQLLECIASTCDRNLAPSTNSITDWINTGRIWSHESCGQQADQSQVACTYRKRWPKWI